MGEQMLDAEVSSVRMLWVGLSGSLDASSWDLLHDCAKEVAAEDGVVIDLRRLDSIDAEGLAAVQRLADTLHALDRQMLMVSAPPTAPG
jgi:anti-anti-sigma regulatory factor